MSGMTKVLPEPKEIKHLYWDEGTIEQENGGIEKWA